MARRSILTPAREKKSQCSRYSRSRDRRCLPNRHPGAHPPSNPAASQSSMSAGTTIPMTPSLPSKSSALICAVHSRTCCRKPSGILWPNTKLPWLSRIRSARRIAGGQPGRALLRCLSFNECLDVRLGSARRAHRFDVAMTLSRAGRFRRAVGASASSKFAAQPCHSAHLRPVPLRQGGAVFFTGFFPPGDGHLVNRSTRMPSAKFDIDSHIRQAVYLEKGRGHHLALESPSPVLDSRRYIEQRPEFFVGQLRHSDRD